MIPRRRPAVAAARTSVTAVGESPTRQLGRTPGSIFGGCSIVQRCCWGQNIVLISLSLWMYHFTNLIMMRHIVTVLMLVGASATTSAAFAPALALPSSQMHARLESSSIGVRMHGRFNARTFQVMQQCYTKYFIREACITCMLVPIIGLVLTS
jgi:hypothetical protein